MPRGLGDQAGDMVHGYAGSRFGGVGAGLFDPKNNNWLSAIVGGVGGGLGSAMRGIGNFLGRAIPGQQGEQTRQGQAGEAYDGPGADQSMYEWARGGG